MHFSRQLDPFTHTIRACGPGEVTVILPYQARPGEQIQGMVSTRQETLRRSLIITPRRLVRDWAPQRFEDLTGDDFQVVMELQPEIVLFGSGGTLRWPDGALTAPLMARGIGVEVMDTAAACRTYNVLTADQRQVAAALLMI